MNISEHYFNNYINLSKNVFTFITYFTSIQLQKQSNEIILLFNKSMESKVFSGILIHSNSYQLNTVNI